MKQIGLFFGSFNPIHIGHLALANYMVEFEHIEEVWFVVSPQNPFKQSNDLLDTSLRIKMVELATKRHSNFRAEDVELSLPLPSYTVHTLKALKEKHPDCEFTIIMGADNIINIQRWKDAHIITDNYNILVYPRPNSIIENIELPSKCKITHAPLIEIASSDIRQWIKAGKSVAYFVHPAVYDFIVNNKIYK